MSKIFIDLGAHLGESVIRFYKDVADATEYKIYAFEPNPALTSQLQQNLKGFSNVEIISKAVSDRDGIVELYVGSMNDADGSTLVLNKHTGNIRYDKPVEVCSINFSNWLQSIIKSQDYVFLKINIEGGEYIVMENLMQSGILNQISRIHLILHAHKIDGEIFKTTAKDIEFKFLSICRSLGIPVITTNDGHKNFVTGE